MAGNAPIFLSKLAIARAKMAKAESEAENAKCDHQNLGKGDNCPYCGKTSATPQGRKAMFRKAKWEETKHKRSGGKFSSKGGPGGKAPAKPGANVTARPGAKRIEEDEVPDKAPGGGKIVDYKGAGSGVAVYSDGAVLDGKGWRVPKKKTTRSRNRRR